MNKPIVIVGQGIAGSTLALELIRRGYKPFVLDASWIFGSTAAAGGSVHPWVLSKQRPTWRGLESFETAQRWYRSAEAMLGLRVWHPLSLYRLSPSGKSPGPSPALASPDTGSMGANSRDAEKHILEDGRIVHAGFGAWLNTRVLVSGIRGYLARRNMLRTAILGERDINFKDRIISLPGGKTLGYSALVLATGLQASQGHGLPWLPPATHLPFYGVLGSIIELYLPELQLPGLIHGPVNILPIPGTGRIRIGTTYHREYKDATTPPNDAQDLCRRAAAILGGFDAADLFRRIEACWSGIRPASRDRLPFMGPVPGYENNGVYCFNGLGTRGLLTAPGLAAQLADALGGTDSLPEDLLPNRGRV
ncbi:NAD(P)/FAD-dependent oxidoreductase [Spirochaeta lutea]|uniref:FAD dependent oxidoreductase domain-containing protein n=1 Tax=Spirochaeta lutea TaxID=1480694 RepID=A0A098QZA5_9SPIO|nr:FAD-dependent oxidoreductase [Spirochaeta lutea]KGE72826.1 hypothetical protein DC28_05500 [Spirochaeta lutea]